MYHYPAGVEWEVAFKFRGNLCFPFSCCCLSLIYLELWRANLDKAETLHQYACDMKKIQLWTSIKLISDYTAMISIEKSIYCYSTLVKQNWPWVTSDTCSRSHQLTYGWHHNLSVSWKTVPVSRNWAPAAAEVLSRSACFSICALTGGKTPDKELNSFLTHSTFLLKRLWAHKPVLVYDLTRVGFSVSFSTSHRHNLCRVSSNELYSF